MAKAKKRTFENLVNTYGFSTEAIRIIRKFIVKEDPTKRQLELALKGFARFLLKAESAQEIKWLKFATTVIKETFKSDVIITKPKPCSFNLPANSYTPDFLHILKDGRRVYVEVKGSEFQPGYRDSIAKLRMTATLYYYDIFILVMPDVKEPNGWKVKIIELDEEYGGIFDELAKQIENELSGE